MIFRLLTTAGLVFEGKVESVILPTTQGEINILPNHADYVGVLGKGWIRINNGKGKKDQWGAINGLVNIKSGILEVLADDIYSKDSEEAKALFTP
jgi:F-type H+-transporting ATPase subunit epsilon